VPAVVKAGGSGRARLNIGGKFGLSTTPNPHQSARLRKKMAIYWGSVFDTIPGPEQEIQVPFLATRVEANRFASREARAPTNLTQRGSPVK